jgi:hypothetical protein
VADEHYVISPAAIYYAPLGEELPDENAVDVGDDWGGNWVNPGDTLTPAVITISRELYEMEIEQATAPVRSSITKENAAIEVTLVEFTGENLLLAFGGSLTETPAGAAQVGIDELVAGGDTSPDQYTWGIEGYWKNSLNVQFPIRFQIYIGEPILGGQLQFAKAAAAGIPLRIAARADTAKAAGQQLYKWQVVTAAALGT